MKEIRLAPKVLSRRFNQFYRKNPSKPLSVVRICDYPTRCKWSSKRFPEDLLGRPTSTVVSVSTVQPLLNQELVLSKTLKCLCTLYMKKRKAGTYFIRKVKHETTPIPQLTRILVPRKNRVTQKLH